MSKIFWIGFYFKNRNVLTKKFKFFDKLYNWVSIWINSKYNFNFVMESWVNNESRSMIFWLVVNAYLT